MKVITKEGSLEQKRFQLMLEPADKSIDDAETTLSGSAFQVLAVAAKKADI